MHRYLRCLGGGLIAALVIGVPWAYCKYYPVQLRNLHVVHDGVLYRSGQLSLPALKRVIHDYGIKTIISLRGPAAPGLAPPDRKEEAYCEHEEIHFVRIPPKKWEGEEEGVAPAAEGVQRFLEIMDDSANYPVLIHCFAGIHRSGAFTAIYRMEYEHWSNQQAIDETIASGYTNLEYENDILGFLTDYRPRWKAEADPPVWATWKKAVLRSAKAGKRKAKTPGD